jgi:hypothetical protein
MLRDRRGTVLERSNTCSDNRWSIWRLLTRFHAMELLELVLEKSLLWPGSDRDDLGPK